MFGVAQAHISIMEKGHENQQALIMGLQYVVNISYVEADEVLKICLDYWNLFVPDVYTTSQTTDVNAQFSFGPISTVRLQCSLLHACSHMCMHSFIHSFIHSLHPSIHPFIRLFVHSSVGLFLTAGVPLESCIYRSE